MSAVPERELTNVHDMESVIRDALVEVEEVDERIHEIRDRLRRRLYAHLAAKNPVIRERLDALRERIDNEDSFSEAMDTEQIHALFSNSK